MRKLILFLAAAVPLAAATTTVTQTVTGPDGQPASGTALIRPDLPELKTWPKAWSIA